MELNEKHHARIIAGFYEELKEKGEQGLTVFVTCARQYGEERGRRMALRALRSRRGLGFPEYFAYSEWEGTPGFLEVSMKAADGAVEERVMKCPWAGVFAGMGLTDCGIMYCREIDRAIVRGFNPELCIELGQSMYLDGCCSFHFRDKAIDEEMFEQSGEIGRRLNGRGRRPMSYHCAHVRSVFSRIITDVYGEEGENMIRRVDRGLTEQLGADLMNALDRYKGEDFRRLPREKGLGGKTDD